MENGEGVIEREGGCSDALEINNQSSVHEGKKPIDTRAA